MKTPIAPARVCENSDKFLGGGRHEKFDVLD